MEEKGLVVENCIDEFFRSGGVGLLDVAVDHHDWEKRVAWGSVDPRIWFSAGIHPSEASRTKDGDLTEVELQTADPRCVAVGEIGLDWYRGRDTETGQHQLFRDQLAIARRRRLPVIIHDREADKELLEDLDGCSWDGRGVIHCFSSDISFARKVLDRGFLISFAGTLTYPSASTLREVAAWAPLEKLLVETDAPFLSPQPRRGKTNSPINAGFTAARLAEVRGVKVEEILQITQDNFLGLFGLTAHMKR